MEKFAKGLQTSPNGRYLSLTSNNPVKAEADRTYQLNNVRFFSVDDRIEAGVRQREVVLDNLHAALAVDVDSSFEVTVGHGLDAHVDVTTLDLDEQVPGPDGSTLKWKMTNEILMSMVSLAKLK